MMKTYQLNSTDQHILNAVGHLLQHVARSACITPAQLVSVAKLQHVLSQLPRTTQGVCVTISISWSVNQGGARGSSGWQFSVADNELTLYCGGSEYTEGVGSDSFTTMSWSARQGRLSDYDEGWDHSWMGPEYPGYWDGGPFHPLGECEITVEDDDNPLLHDGEDDDDSREESPLPRDI